MAVMVTAVSVGLYASLMPPTTAYSQDAGLATFHESAVVLVDRTGSKNVSASITLQSTSTLELQVPAALERDVREGRLVTAITLTNQETCVLGVSSGLSCVLVTVERDPEAVGIASLQESARSTADSHIDMINAAFDTDASFHSVFVHSGGKSSDTAPGLPGTAAGRTTVSVVYVMPMEDTGAMYDKISSILLASQIRNSGGFYDAARHLSAQDGSKMSFSIIPLDSKSLLQLKVISYSAINASQTDVIRPLDMLGLDSMARSEYFESGFYPLNSVMQVAVLSDGADVAVSGSTPAALSTVKVDDEEIPVDVSKTGWIFDPPSGKVIQAKYLFGQKSKIASDDLVILLADNSNNMIGTNPNNATGNGGTNPTIRDIDVVGEDTDEQIMVVIAVVAIAAAAVMFYMRGYSGRQVSKVDS